MRSIRTANDFQQSVVVSNFESEITYHQVRCLSSGFIIATSAPFLPNLIEKLFIRSIIGHPSIDERGRHVPLLVIGLQTTQLHGWLVQDFSNFASLSRNVLSIEALFVCFRKITLVTKETPTLGLPNEQCQRCYLMLPNEFTKHVQIYSHVCSSS